MNTKVTQVVHLFIFDTMPGWEAAFTMAAAGNPRFHSLSADYRVVTIAASLKPVTTADGTRIQPDLCLDSVTPADSAMLILPGGYAWDTEKNAGALRLAVEFIALGVPVAAFSGAARALTRTGLFDQLGRGKDARQFLISSGERGTAFYCGGPAGVERNALPPSRVAPVDLAREIFRTLDLNFHSSAKVRSSGFDFASATGVCALAECGTRSQS